MSRQAMSDVASGGGCDLATHSDVIVADVSFEELLEFMLNT